MAEEESEKVPEKDPEKDPEKPPEKAPEKPPEKPAEKKPRDEMRQIFDYFDKGGKGTMNKENLTQAVRYLGIIKNLNDFNFILKDLDQEINYEKFSEIVTKCRETEITSEDLVNAFAAFDTKNTGKVNTKNIFRVLSVCGEKLDEDDVELFKGYAKLADNADTMFYKSAIKNMMDILKKGD